MALVKGFARKYFLNGSITNIRSIALTLNTIFDVIFIRNNINTLVSSCFCIFTSKI